MIPNACLLESLTCTLGGRYQGHRESRRRGATARACLASLFIISALACIGALALLTSFHEVLCDQCSSCGRMPNGVAR